MMTTFGANSARVQVRDEPRTKTRSKWLPVWKPDLRNKGAGQDAEVERCEPQQTASQEATHIRARDVRDLRVRDLMSTDVISVAPNTPVREIAALLAENRISSVPVITSTRGRLVGIVSEGDLLRRVELGTEPLRSWWQSLFTDAMTAARDYVRSHGRTARDVMTMPCITGDPDELLHKLATRMSRKGLRRVPVVRDGRVIGVIGRSDLVRQLASFTAPSARLSDEEIRKDIEMRVASLPWNVHVHLANAEVQDGVANLYGWATSDVEKRAIEVVAENTPGIVGVRSCVHRALPYV